MRFFKLTLGILLALVILGIPAASQAQVAVGVSVHVGPPALPEYEQPLIPGPGYLWTPGYWAYGPGGYYWVPGVWVEPPSVGLLWTPGYWGWGGGVYVWHGGYWGPHVGFYGGINYGYGYTGAGYGGGYWRGREFYYNRSVTNVNTTIIHNTYNTTVVNNNAANRTAFNGGPGGVAAKPSTQELAAGREAHVQPTALQSQHQQAASTNRAMLASTNHGQPAVAATSKPGVFKGPGVVAARPAGTAQASANTGVAKGNATGVNAQANARTANQAQGRTNTAANTVKPTPQAGQPHPQQPTYGAKPQQAQTGGAHPQQPTYGAQPHTNQPIQSQVQPQHQGQPAQQHPHQEQPQQHPRENEPQGGKPHKP